MNAETLIYIYNLLNEKAQLAEQALDAAEAARKAAMPEDGGDVPDHIEKAYREAWEENRKAASALEDFHYHEWR